MDMLSLILCKQSSFAKTDKDISFSRFWNSIKWMQQKNGQKKIPEYN